MILGMAKKIELVKNNPDEEKYLHYFSDERTGKRQFDRSMFKSLYMKYMDDSCKVFMDDLGESFYRAKYDAEFHHDIRIDQPNLYRAWAYVELCTDAFVRPGERYFEEFSHWPVRELADHSQDIADDEENDDDDDVEDEDARSYKSDDLDDSKGSLSYKQDKVT